MNKGKQCFLLKNVIYHVMGTTGYYLGYLKWTKEKGNQTYTVKDIMGMSEKKLANGPVLIKTEIPSFYLNQGSSTPIPANLMMRIYGNHVCSKQAPLSYFKGLEMRIFSFWQKDTGAKRVSMATTLWGYLFFLWCTFLVPSLKNTASNFQRYSLFSICKPHDIITFLICIILKCQYLKCFG